MAIEGSLRCVRFLMLVFNLIFLILGVSLFILGIVITSQFTDYSALGHGFNVAPVIVILTGFIIAFISFFGCYGAYKENRCMINFFAICVFVIFVLQVACIIAAFVTKGKADVLVEEALVEIVKNYTKNASYKEFMDFCQDTLRCCGIQNYTNYEGVFTEGDRVPQSCCKDTTNCTTSFDPKNPREKHDFFEEGCSSKVATFLKVRIEIVIVVAAVICFIELLAILFSCCMSRNIEKYEMV